MRIQIWTALIAVLVVRYLQFRSNFRWAVSNLVALLRWNLFTYRDLWEWLNRPFDTPPEPALQPQLILDSTCAAGWPTSFRKWKNPSKKTNKTRELASM